MIQVEMNGAVRTETGKGAMRQLRIKGMTPAVVYGHGSAGLALQFETQPLYQQLLKIYRKNAVVILKLDNGDVKNVLIKDVQAHPVKDTLIHVDFQEIDLNKSRIFSVPVEYTGTAKGCDLGGILQVDLTSVMIEAAPLNVPDVITVDISKMNIAETLKVSDIVVDSGVTILTAGTTACVTILAPKKVEKEVVEEKGKKGKKK